MNKIAFIQTAFIGDAVLATAAIDSLHRKFPSAEIHLLVRKGNETLFQSHPYISKVWSWNKEHKKISSLLSILAAFRSEHFDLIINLQRFASTGFLTTFSKAKIKIGFKENPWSLFFTHRFPHIIDSNTHEVHRNQSLLSPFTREKFSKPILFPSPSDFDSVKKYQHSPYSCIAPASVWFTKQVPEKKWVELIQKSDPSSHFILLGGPSDQNLCQSIIKVCQKNNVIELCGQLSLLQSCALMKNAEMNYVNDSAPLHLASAVNAPVTVFYCSTVKDFGFYPLSDESNIIEASPPPPCKPCGLHGKRNCPLGHFSCGNNLPV